MWKINTRVQQYLSLREDFSEKTLSLLDISQIIPHPPIWAMPQKGGCFPGKFSLYTSMENFRPLSSDLGDLRELAEALGGVLQVLELTQLVPPTGKTRALLMSKGCCMHWSPCAWWWLISTSESWCDHPQCLFLPAKVWTEQLLRTRQPSPSSQVSCPRGRAFLLGVWNSFCE